MMEENLRRALMISDGQLNFLWERPITLAFTSIAVLVLLSPLLTIIWKYAKGQKNKGTNSAH